MPDNRTPAGFWGESKKRFQIMLTPTALERLEKVSKEYDMSRGEIIERLCRSELCTPEQFSQLSASKWQGRANISKSNQDKGNKESTMSD